MITLKLGLKQNESRARALVQPFYRTLGRIMLYCIAMDNTLPEGIPNEEWQKQRFLIAAQALPNIYRNYLLRGIDPTNNRYRIGDH